MRLHKTRPVWMIFGIVLASLAARIADAATNQSVLPAARAAQPSLIQSLHDMVSIESGSDDTTGVEKMAEYTTSRLRALGAETEVVPSTNGKPPGMVKGAFRGTGKLRLMMIAHMDTVYRNGILQTEPYRRDGNRLYGPGIADNKGGIAVILHSIAILKEIEWQDYAQLTVRSVGRTQRLRQNSRQMSRLSAQGRDEVHPFPSGPAARMRPETPS